MDTSQFDIQIAELEPQIDALREEMETISTTTLKADEAELLCSNRSMR